MLNFLLIVHIISAAITAAITRRAALAVAATIAGMLYFAALLTHTPWVVYTALTLIAVGNSIGLIEGIHLKCTAITSKSSQTALLLILVSVFILIAIAHTIVNFQ